MRNKSASRPEILVKSPVDLSGDREQFAAA
jgi:hypothetical protein